MKKAKRTLAFILSAIVLVTTISTTGMVAFAGDGEFLGLKPSYNASDWTGKTVLTKEIYDSKYFSYVVTHTYNSAGFITKDVTKYSDGDTNTRTRSYDSNNNLVKDVMVYFDGEKYIATYTYNSKGYITKLSINDDEDGTKTTSYYYNDAGYVSKIVEIGDISYTKTYTYNSKNQVIKEVYSGEYYSSTTTYSYDSKGRRTKVDYEDSDGDIEISTVTYNDAGLVAKEYYKTNYYDEDDGTFISFWRSLTYTYDSNNNLTKKVSKDSDGDTITNVYTYTNGRLTKDACSSPYGKNETTYTYDSKGNMTKEYFVDIDGEWTKYSYSYDKAGNVIKEVALDSYGYGSTKTTEYNSTNDVTKETYTSSEGESSSSEYEYKTLSNTTCYIDGRIHLSYAKTTYDGKAKKPYVAIDYLNKGEDYQVVYSNNVKAGKGVATIKFKESYDSNDVNISFDINKQKISSSNVTLSNTSYTYDGTYKKPTVTVKNAAGTKLGTSNYTVAYSNNKVPGTATVTITMKGNYSGTIKKTFTIKPQAVKSANVTLSATSYTYDGTYKKPTVTVKNAAGTKLGTSHYTVAYSNNKAVGKATVTVTMKGNYSGTIKKTFKINPKGTSMSTLTATSGGFKATWKKQATQTTGYILQYSTNSDMSNYKTYTSSSNSTLSKSVTGLSKGKKYYVRVRTYKTVDSTKYYSAWSSKMAVTTK